MSLKGAQCRKDETPSANAWHMAALSRRGMSQGYFGTTIFLEAPPIYFSKHVVAQAGLSVSRILKMSSSEGKFIQQFGV
jgi:hypothetical protein